MLRKTALALVALSLPLTVSANNWSVGGGYLNFSNDSDGIDVSLGSLYGSVAYIYQTEHKKFSIVPELKLGTGISDDSVRLYGTKVDVELERFVNFSVKAQYDVTDQVFVFVMPSYANAKIEASVGGFSESDSEWEFGVGTGIGYQFNAQTDVALSYEKFDDTDVISAGFNYSF
jgi:predicted porin